MGWVYRRSKSQSTYEEVSSGATGHFESIEVIYDPAKVGYDKLLEVFWRNIDPTDPGGEFADRGQQYQTAIFYHNENQKKLAETSKDALQKSGKFNRPIATKSSRLRFSTRPKSIIRIISGKTLHTMNCIGQVPAVMNS